MSAVIQRHHYFRLKAPHNAPEERAETARRCRESLATLPGVRGITVGLPADDHAEAAWDLTIVMQFETLEDIDAYRADPQHRKFVDEILAPRIDVKKIWNFTTSD